MSVRRWGSLPDHAATSLQEDRVRLGGARIRVGHAASRPRRTRDRQEAEFGETHN